MHTQQENIEQQPANEVAQAKAQKAGNYQSPQGKKATHEAKQRPVQRMKDYKPHSAQHNPVQLKPQTTDTTPNRSSSSNNTGLPNQLKTGIEQLSGYSMDDVRVHRNSDKPAQLKAHAYAQGSDIHLASGQEQHLPHEAWHVVQQKQGRVQPTTQFKGKAGVNINDDARLEHEADVMGQKAMQMGTSSTAVSLRAAPLNQQAVSQRKVFQLVTSQVHLNENARITGVTVRGRPKSIFSGSMGDHTTAFIVQTEGINIALQNCTIAEAITYMQTLSNDLTQLPGYSLMNIVTQQNQAPQSKTKVGAFFLHEYGLLNRHLQAANQQRDGNIAMHHLQLAIDAYLSARELIPLSTINVGAINKGIAGKGHGEAKNAAILSTYERKEKDVADDVLVNAVYGLFDQQSAGMLATQSNAGNIAAMTAGLSFGNTNDPKVRMQLVWEQHRLTIARMFPRVFAKIGNALNTDRLQENLQTLRKVNLTSLLHQAYIQLKYLNDSISAFSSNYSRGKKNPYYRKGAGKLNEKMLNDLAYMRQVQQNIMKTLDEIRPLNNELNNEFIGNIYEIEQKLLAHNKDINDQFLAYDHKRDKHAVQSALANKVQQIKPGKYDAQKTINAIKSFENGDILTDFKPIDEPLDEAKHLDIDFKNPQKYKKAAVETSTLTQGMSAMSVQIILNPNNGRVTGMRSGGRPPSPFKGTMGAHTTSWVVHLDRVRARINGMTIADAATEMQRFMAEVNQIAQDQSKQSKGNNARYIYDDAQQRMENYRGLDPENANIGILQQMIEAALAFYNLIPGVSRDKIDTTGHGEGTYRQTLLRYEHYGHGTQEELQTAIKGLYDGGYSGYMYGLHGRFIQQAYPNAAHFADTGESRVKKVAIPKDAVIGKDTEEDESVLTTDQVAALNDKKSDADWLVGVNNCLINAITDAAGQPRATAEQIIAIRIALGVPLGTMLYATQGNLNTIVNTLGGDYPARGVRVVYEGSVYTDQTSVVGDDLLHVYHDGVNHFTALHDPDAKPIPKRRGRSKESRRRRRDYDSSRSRSPYGRDRRDKSRSRSRSKERRRHRSRDRDRDRDRYRDSSSDSDRKERKTRRRGYSSDSD